MNKHLFFASILLAGFTAAPAAAEVGGARVEGMIGWDGPRLGDFAGQDNVHESGIVFGVGLGYDLPIGRSTAIGIDLEASDSNASFRDVSPAGDIGYSLGRDLYAGARLTVGVSDDVNLYFKAGYTNQRATSRVVTPNFSETITFNTEGGRAGAGLQFGLGPNAYLSGEYRYSDYSGELARHQAVAGIGLRF